MVVHEHRVRAWGSEMLTVERFNTKLYFDDDGFTELPYVYGPLRTGRVYEEKFLEHVRSLGRRGDYVDVGAHLGTHTAWPDGPPTGCPRSIRSGSWRTRPWPTRASTSSASTR